MFNNFKKYYPLTYESYGAYEGLETKTSTETTAPKQPETPSAPQQPVTSSSTKKHSRGYRTNGHTDRAYHWRKRNRPFGRRTRRRRRFPRDVYHTHYLVPYADSPVTEESTESKTMKWWHVVLIVLAVLLPIVGILIWLMWKKNAIN